MVQLLLGYELSAMAIIAMVMQYLFGLLIDLYYTPTMNTLCIIMIITFTIWILVTQIIYYRKLPPGPWGVPLLGCLPFLSGMPPHVWYLGASAKYGDIFSVKMGNNLVVCVGSAKLLKDLFFRGDTTARPHTPLNNLMEGHGIILSEGALWKRQRQFLHDKFRALGVKLLPNQRFEKFVLTEIDELLVKIESTLGTPFDPTDLFGRHIHNIICQLMMSFRFDEKNEEFIMFNERVTRGMKLYGSILIGEHVKHYVKLPGKQAVLNEIKRNLQDISEFHVNHINKRIKQRKMCAGHYEPVDLLDHYLDVLDKEKSNGYLNELFPNVKPDRQIVQIMNDLFSAGMETSRTSLTWCLVMMLREPEIADKVRIELRNVLPLGHTVTLEHRSRLPYLEAVLFETLRRVAVVPLGTTHVNSKTLHVGGYVIPKGTHLIPLINKISLDPELYPEPEAFKPERFLKNGQLRVPDNFMIFGVGQRMCLGTQLARMELFLFFANIMNSYTFHLPEDDAMPGLDGVTGTTHAPLPYKVIFKKLDN